MMERSNEEDEKTSFDYVTPHLTSVMYPLTSVMRERPQRNRGTNVTCANNLNASNS